MAVGGASIDYPAGAWFPCSVLLTRESDLVGQAGPVP